MIQETAFELEIITAVQMAPSTEPAEGVPVGGQASDVAGKTVGAERDRVCCLMVCRGDQVLPRSSFALKERVDSNSFSILILSDRLRYFAIFGIPYCRHHKSVNPFVRRMSRRVVSAIPGFGDMEITITIQE
ncbi:MAG: hypothetical protein LKM41_04700 [Lachnospiraceae bacterium]|jgi:hypothetical protein|nr:hypothetical protein [Lachnospiraceae bacterium]